MNNLPNLDPGWNYRVVRLQQKDLPDIYTIEEAYYEDGKVSMLTKYGCSPKGETPEELKEDIECFMRAFNAPIIDFHTMKEIS